MFSRFIFGFQAHKHPQNSEQTNQKKTLLQNRKYSQYLISNDNNWNFILLEEKVLENTLFGLDEGKEPHPV